jgi:ferredoxin-NADP reductase/nitrite reductase/ring-hydroxylating ferredoxin subunit
MRDSAGHQWYPIAAAADVPFRHIYHGQLLGRELAVWRADDGFVNVWENRCLHRGVRLSIGINDGRELVCQYHGWRYANRSAGCTYIPAHPADAPARRITNRVFPSLERHGLIWTTEEADAEPPPMGSMALMPDDAMPLRAVYVHAPAGQVSAALEDYAAAEDRLRLFVQPLTADRSAIRGVLARPADAAQRLDLLRRHNEALGTLRDRLERDAAQLPPPPPLSPRYDLVDPAFAALAEPVSGAAPLRVILGRKWAAAQGVAGLELRPLRGDLPSFQPGAHIDLHLGNGLVRQYSLINGPGESAHYQIGVKLEAASAGGSDFIHNHLREGDLLAVSPPRNNFPLRRDATQTLLIAGGIGITPLLAMAQALRHMRLAFTLHYFAQGQTHLAFPERLRPLGDHLVSHLGLDAPGTAAALEAILAGPAGKRHAYLCGPGPMLSAARAIAAAAGWPDDAVHFEYFKNTNEIDSSGVFTIELARSGLTLPVPAGKTILNILRENGIGIASSCEQGACGTCAVTVLEGEPLHQDVYLQPGERAANRTIMTCVSRAKSGRLVLDV